jgi:glutaminase
VVDGSAVGDVLSVMYSAGMYDYSGEWAHRTGLPAKSGVSGGIAALIPGQVGVGVFSPPVDDRGNSVRGVAVCEDLSARLGLHLFRSRPRTLPPLRSVSTGTERRSLRVWPHREAELLERHGDDVLVVEAQGPWSFVACARLFAVVEERDPKHLVVEVSRVGTVDGAAATLMREFLVSAAAAGIDVVVAGSGRDPFDGAAKRFPSLDAALEWCEARVLESVGRGAVQAAGVVPLADSDLGRGLPPDQLAALERIGVRRLVDPAEPITRAGDGASSLLLVLSGHLTALVDGRRVAAFGPGSLIGEMGFLTGAPRSATVRADESCVVMEFPSFDGLEPTLVAELHRRLGVILAGRLAAATRSTG